MTQATPPRDDDTRATDSWDEHGETQVLTGEDRVPPSDEAEGNPGGGEGAAEADALVARAEAAEEDRLRAIAELDNVRKRSARELENARRFAVERLAADLLGVVDSLQMGLEAAEKEGAGGALLEGLQATLRQLNGVLERHGVTPVEAQGRPFDPEVHEAMSMVPDSEAAPGTVVAVVQSGYLLNGRLLRPARVMVAAEGSAQQG